jgi:hypothetical protein
MTFEKAAAPKHRKGFMPWRGIGTHRHSKSWPEYVLQVKVSPWETHPQSGGPSIERGHHAISSQREKPQMLKMWERPRFPKGPEASVLIEPWTGKFQDSKATEKMEPKLERLSQSLCYYLLSSSITVTVISNSHHLISFSS